MFFITGPMAFGQLGLDYYLPDMEYDPGIPTPKSVLNFEIGEWHLTHGQLYYYMTRLCEASENCSLTEYAWSHENKPLFYLTISSKSNMSRLDELKKKHRQLCDPTVSDSLVLDNLPLVLYQGYSVHGDESSGANASTLVAYYLLAGQSDKIKLLLDNTIILLDPCFNPDGFQRFSTWANSNRHSRLNTDPADREFNELWPTGRTNHYWFDLNRDWLFAIHPSTQGRIKTFHEWKPDILTDHHEMGSNSSFFFQPGVPSRTNPNTPQINQDLTEEIGNYHAAFLDSIGSSYFTKERYDDFYYGKGSTYPDINGSIGILFEQATSEGHLRETRNGLLSFPFTIRNQFVASLSTQEAAMQMKNRLLDYKRSFYRDVSQSPISTGYFIFEESDPFKSRFMCEMLERHDIKVFTTNTDITLDGQIFTHGESYLVPKNQYQAALIKAMFEKVSTFRDSVFYDVSAWTIPLAFNMKYAESFDPPGQEWLSPLPDWNSPGPESFLLSDRTHALALDWSHYMAPALLDRLLEDSIRVQALSRTYRFNTPEKETDLHAGTLIIALPDKSEEREELAARVLELAREFRIEAIQIQDGMPLKTMLSDTAFCFEVLKPSIAVLVGEGVNAYEAGDCWYQLDKRWQMKITLLDVRDLAGADLSRYNCIIMPDGYYSSLGEHTLKLKQWIRAGGKLIALRKAVVYLMQKQWLTGIKSVEISGTSNLGGSRESNQIGGSILEGVAQLDHPLFYGYRNQTIPVFKKGTQFYRVEKDSAVPLSYAKSDPLMSGYMSLQNRLSAPGSASVICASFGEGQIIASVDNPNFRAYWLAGSRLFANMIFMTNNIRRASML